MIAIGHLVGYGAGTIDLVKILGPTLGDSQFKQLTLIAAVFFNVAVGLTAWAVQERVLISSK
jgi:solute carrier family 45 protein 1/2/4